MNSFSTGAEDWRSSAFPLKIYIDRMQGNIRLWENRYAKEEKNLWGLNPIDTLAEYVSIVETRGKLLDLGMGEGIDISETAVTRALSYAKENSLIIKAKVSDLISFEIK
jgi:tellurite methyltransferase